MRFVSGVFVFWFLLSATAASPQIAGSDIASGKVRDASGNAVGHAMVLLRLAGAEQSVTSDIDGNYRFPAARAGRYQLAVEFDGRQFTLPQALDLPAGHAIDVTLTKEGTLAIYAPASSLSAGKELAGNAVAAIPLNKRDFSQILLLAAGTMTDSNGASNFTQQFAVNGQRGVEAVFAMDGADISDPEMGGATFSNFNVDAVREIQSASGWMAADIGRGAAGFTNIVTRSGSDKFHGSLFEFFRNSALDARNFFDRRSFANPGRIPPFRRNEFGFTAGGPVAKRTFFFAEYQGFRQVLGTTQVLPVPTANERAGIDTTAFPGDTLIVPVNPKIAPLINRYPLPNDPQGPFGTRTYATSSKVATVADQFSGRLDHKLSNATSLFVRYTLDNLNGPTTNPDQSAIDPTFRVVYLDRQKNAVISLTHTPSASFISESSISFTRTTPSFPTPNHTDPALTFGDGLYESFNAAGGSTIAAYGNLFQARQNFSWIHGNHAIKFGAEFRANRDTTYFGTGPNGQYTFGGGTAYSPVNISSGSGAHQIRTGDPLPDTLSALLTGSAFSFNQAVAPASLPQGDQIGVAAITRNNVNVYVEDTWRLSNRFQVDYGLRYELYTPIQERARRSAALRFVNDANGRRQEYLINPEPRYRMDANGWGPRLRLNWMASKGLWIRAGGALTTIPTNIWQDNALTGSGPYVDYPRLTASPGAPLLIGTRISPNQLPGVFTPSGANILASGNSKTVPRNTIWDVDRFSRELAALSPSHQPAPLNMTAISQDFRNAYLATWSLAIERSIASLNASAAYIGTAGVSLPAVNYPNGYAGAIQGFAPYTKFNATGQAVGGFGTEFLITNRSHSSYHSLQTSLQGTVPGGGPDLLASYTFSKSIDDVSTVLGGLGTGAISLPFPQNPFDTRAEKGLSTFDVTHGFSLSAIQDLRAERAAFLNALPRALTAGWQLLTVATLASGSPFTVNSGVQQTGAGSEGADRPDQTGKPHLSTSRAIREDYFGLAENNGSLFFIPINVPGGTGPNQGAFGTLGRNTFRGPAFHNFDFALIKDTPLLVRSGRELAHLQSRAEFFNLFNIVNFGLPSSTIRGSGFGEINHTASNSRQIQFSLKLMF